MRCTVVSLLFVVAACACVAAATPLPLAVQTERAWMLDASVVPQGYTNSSASPSNGWVLYKQCGESWSNDRIGTSPTNTICDVGCAMSSVAMALKTLGTNVDPGTLNQWLIKNGGFVSNDLLVWGSVAKFGTMSLYNYYHGAGSLSQTDMKSTIARHWPIIANVRNGGHWVLVVGVGSNGDYLVNDPGFSVNSYSYADMSNFVVYSTR